MQTIRNRSAIKFDTYLVQDKSTTMVMARNDKDHPPRPAGVLQSRLQPHHHHRRRYGTILQRCSLRLCYAMLIVIAIAYCSARYVSFQVNHKELLKAPINDIERECPGPKYPVVGRSNNNSTKKLNICITTLTDEAKADILQRLIRWRDFNNLLDLTWPNKQNYCHKHGYQLFNESRTSLDTSRPPSWSKIRAAQRLLKEEQCDWVFWMDADTVIMNSNKRIEDFLPTAETGIDLIITIQKDNGWNAGAWLIRNTDWSMQFLDHWWSMREYVQPKGLGVSGDNSALKAYLASMDPDTFSKHIAVPPRCLFNSVTKWVQKDDPPLDTAEQIHKYQWYMHQEFYHKGDFVAHVAGVSNKITTTEMLLRDAV